jgi:hypothetical protein
VHQVGVGLWLYYDARSAKFKKMNWECLNTPVLMRVQTLQTGWNKRVGEIIVWLLALIFVGLHQLSLEWTHEGHDICGIFDTHAEFNICNCSYVRSGMDVIDLPLLSFTSKGHWPFGCRRFGKTYCLIIRGKKWSSSRLVYGSLLGWYKYYWDGINLIGMV